MGVQILQTNFRPWFIRLKDKEGAILAKLSFTGFACDDFNQDDLHYYPDDAEVLGP